MNELELRKVLKQFDGDYGSYRAAQDMNDLTEKCSVSIVAQYVLSRRCTDYILCKPVKEQSKAL